MSVTTTVERCEVEDVSFDCEAMPEGEIRFRKLSIRVLEPHKLSRTLRKKARTAMRKQAFIESVDATSERIVCWLDRSANAMTLEQLLRPIAQVIKNSGQSTRHRSSPCHIKQRRLVSPAVRPVKPAKARGPMKVRLTG